jgi:hypothetical protein
MVNEPRPVTFSLHHILDSLQYLDEHLRSHQSRHRSFKLSPHTCHNCEGQQTHHRRLQILCRHPNSAAHETFFVTAKSNVRESGVGIDAGVVAVPLLKPVAIRSAHGECKFVDKTIKVRITFPSHP